ncbi:hypothetical protein Cs7R123_07830 [Catellatospora sp. TT07R-123]|uniref:hypothetical protein n=1 Tax=Catellatospora sp. TT07R-123 TaxID=2733863 RepID=UPI001AFD2A56|nr:hypothetical protein [Catellatospora sp. TT07R-123]GHJ43441.1 hypothetical protein Cs7R123_07830 [Catellatospora sp. TT07R-123]
MDDDDDGWLLEALAQAARQCDPLPDSSFRVAAGAFALRSLDADLADLTFDTLAEAGQPVRSSAQPRLLTFQHGPFTIELELTGTGSAHHLIGQVLPAGPARLDIRAGARTVAVAADELGRFACADLPPGPLSVRLYAAGHDIVTDWVTV